MFTVTKVYYTDGHAEDISPFVFIYATREAAEKAILEDHTEEWNSLFEDDEEPEPICPLTKMDDGNLVDTDDYPHGDYAEWIIQEVSLVA